MLDNAEQLLSADAQPLLLLLFANLFLYLFAPWIMDLIGGSNDPDQIASRSFRINLMRAINLLAIVIIAITLITGKTGIINSFLVKALLALVILSLIHISEPTRPY